MKRMSSILIVLLLSMTVFSSINVLSTTDGINWNKISKTRYAQYPNPEGWDVFDCDFGFLADDWLCTESGNITGIIFWGSWYGDIDPTSILGFDVYIFSDTPANESITGYSMPNVTLWNEYFPIEDIEITQETPMSEGWYDPYEDTYELDNHLNYYRYDIINISSPFYQTNGTIYWLGIIAEVDNVLYPDPPLWGWKSSNNHWNDDAVYMDRGDWYELKDPITTESLDLSFALLGEDVVLVDDDFTPSIAGWNINRFSNIQDAVEHVPVGGTVIVYDGTYNENVRINYSLDLVGVSSKPAINGQDSYKSTIEVMADYVNISNFTINNPGGYSNGYHGIAVGKTQTELTSQYHVNIYDCYIGTEVGNGILLRSGSDLNVYRCEINNAHSDGIWCGADYCSIIDCNIHDGLSNGIQLYMGDNVIIEGNSIHDNSMTGIKLFYANGNTIYLNNISNSGAEGLYCWSNCNNNVIYHNNFVNNNPNAKDLNTNSNKWNMSYPICGNYYDDHDTSDNYWGPNQDQPGSDGIVDGGSLNPYSTGGNPDYYPFVNPTNGSNATPIPAVTLVYVDDDADPSWYDATHVKTIQEGIDNVTAGFLVIVEPGIYTESPIIDKHLTLRGNGTVNTDVELHGELDIKEYLNTPWINVENMYLNGTGQIRALYIRRANYVNITDCKIYSDGIYVVMIQGRYCTFKNNTIEQDYSGGYMVYSSTISSWTEGDNTFINNTFNGLEKSDRGLTISDETGNALIKDNIFNECNYGLYMTVGGGLIYHNQFYNNTHQAYDSTSTNRWNETYGTYPNNIIGGNYWNDHNTTDDYHGVNQNLSGSDGIVDDPYYIDSDSIDYYPLLSPPSNTPPTITDENPSDGHKEMPTSFIWQVNISDEDGDLIDWSIECNGQSNSSTGDTSGIKTLFLTNLSKATTYTVYVNATDNTDWTRKTFTFDTIDSEHIQFYEHPFNPIYGEYIGDGEAYYPCVIYDENKFSGHGNSSYFKMWYDAGDGTPRLLLSDNGIDFGNFSDSIPMTNLSNAYHPTVIYDSNAFNGTGYYYRMYYWTGSVSSLSTRVAESTDGIHWENDQPITQNSSYPLYDGICGNAWWYHHYGPANIYYNPSATNTGDNPWNYSFVMTFDTSSEGVCSSTGGVEYTGLAYSKDGFNWTRYGEEPILITYGDSGKWDRHYSYHGDIVKISDNEWRMWYSGGDDDSDGGKYYAEGIGEAYSTDGIHWYKCEDNPIFHFSDNVSWRDYRTYTPNVVLVKENILMMYFTGADHDNKSIGLALYRLNNAQPHVPTLIFPNNQTDYESVYFRIFNCTVIDMDNDTLDVSFYWGNGTLISTIHNVSNNSEVKLNLSEIETKWWLEHDTTYTWYVVVSDMQEEVRSATWWFHTSKAPDINEDRHVDYLDVSDFVPEYGDSGFLPGALPEDIIEDGSVQYLDVSNLVYHYGDIY